MAIKQKVESYELSDPDQKHKYEYIMNTYQIVREEFAYMKDGTPKVTVWYVVED